jgi:hypothetical protein
MNKMLATKPLIGAALALAVVVGSATACSAKGREPFKDAPVQGKHDRTPARIIEMPDGFSNLATKCVDGMRYTVAYHGDHAYGAITVSADPACAVTP